MKTLDIKGEVCPYTFVKTKLALEQIKGSDTLKVITDHMPAVDNVSRSCSNEGHEIVSSKKINDTDWEIVIRKKLS